MKIILPFVDKIGLSYFIHTIKSGSDLLDLIRSWNLNWPSKIYSTVVDETECDQWAAYMEKLINVQHKYTSMAYEFEIAKVALEEVKSRTSLLGTGKLCPIWALQELC